MVDISCDLPKASNAEDVSKMSVRSVVLKFQVLYHRLPFFQSIYNSHLFLRSKILFMRSLSLFLAENCSCALAQLQNFLYAVFSSEHACFKYKMNQLL